MSYESRYQFFRANERALAKLVRRAKEREHEEGTRYAVVCIDPDDPVWRPLVDLLMPGHNWGQVRQEQGPGLVARGVVPLAMIAAYVRTRLLWQPETVIMPVARPDQVHTCVYVLKDGGASRIEVSLPCED